MNNSGMRLRSQVPQSEKDAEKLLAKKPKINVEDLPFIDYKGKLNYSTTLIDCAMVCDILLKRAHECEELFPIGFDIEWPFSFQTGPGKASVIQLSPSLDECYILHVSKIKNLPKSLTVLLEHPKVRLAGVNIKNDIRKLARDFTGVNAEVVISNCIDAGTQANRVLSSQGRWSMAKLVQEFFQMSINKDRKVRMSKWHIIPLSKEQQKYAAIDAYASLKLYFHLNQLEMEMASKENEPNFDNI